MPPGYCSWTSKNEVGLQRPLPMDLFSRKLSGLIRKKSKRYVVERSWWALQSSGLMSLLAKLIPFLKMSQVHYLIDGWPRSLSKSKSNLYRFKDSIGSPTYRFIAHNKH